MDALPILNKAVAYIADASASAEDSRLGVQPFSWHSLMPVHKVTGMRQSQERKITVSIGNNFSLSARQEELSGLKPGQVMPL